MTSAGAATPGWTWPGPHARRWRRGPRPISPGPATEAGCCQILPVPTWSNVGFKGVLQCCVQRGSKGFKRVQWVSNSYTSIIFKMDASPCHPNSPLGMWQTCAWGEKGGQSKGMNNCSAQLASNHSPKAENKRSPVLHKKTSGKIRTMVLTWYHCRTRVLIGILWNCQEWTDMNWMASQPTVLRLATQTHQEAGGELSCALGGWWQWQIRGRLFQWRLRVQKGGVAPAASYLDPETQVRLQKFTSSSKGHHCTLGITIWRCLQHLASDIIAPSRQDIIINLTMSMLLLL